MSVQISSATTIKPLVKGKNRLTEDELQLIRGRYGNCNRISLLDIKEWTGAREVGRDSLGFYYVV